MSFSKIPAAFPSSWFLLAGFKNKKLGLTILKDPTFGPAFTCLQGEFDALLAKLADAVRPLYVANKDTLAPIEKKSRSKKEEEVEDLDDAEESDSEPVEEEEEEAVSDDEETPIVSKIKKTAKKSPAESSRRRHTESKGHKKVRNVQKNS